MSNEFSYTLQDQDPKTFSLVPRPEIISTAKFSSLWYITGELGRSESEARITSLKSVLFHFLKMCTQSMVSTLPPTPIHCNDVLSQYETRSNVQQIVQHTFS